MFRPRAEESIKYGLIPELVGRLPVITALNALDADALVRIMTEPKNALVKQYQYIFSMDGVELVFEDEALQAIANKTLEYNTGARGLRSVIEKLLLGYMYDIPSDGSVSRITITKDVVEGIGEPVLEHDGAALPEDRSSLSSFPAKK